VWFRDLDRQIEGPGALLAGPGDETTGPGSQPPKPAAVWQEGARRAEELVADE